MSDRQTQVFEGRIGVIGAGALGIFYGARLFRAGFDVHFYVRTGYEIVREHGYRIRSCDGDFEIHPPVYDSPAGLGHCDLVLVGLKTLANDLAMKHRTHFDRLFNYLNSHA